MHLEAKDNGVVILGNAKCDKYRSFEWNITPVVNRLGKEKLEECVDKGFIKLDKHGNPIGNRQ
jgi:hypothetical protein